MPKIILMCGLPRSGKTTWANNKKNCHFNDYRGCKLVICADDLRKIVYNNRYWQEGEPLMWSIHDIILRFALKQKIDIIIDECNVTEKRRKPLIQMGKEFGYQVNCAYIMTPWIDCLERAKKENDLEIIPVIERMSNQFEEPSYKEGFDLIERFANYLNYGLDYEDVKKNKDGGK